MPSISRRSTIAGSATFLLGATLLLGGAARPALADNDQQRLVDRARLALDEFHDDGNFEKMRVYIQNAQAVAVFPELLKAGLIVGVEAGQRLDDGAQREHRQLERPGLLRSSTRAASACRSAVLRPRWC